MMIFMPSYGCGIVFSLSRYEISFGQYLGLIEIYCCSYWFVVDMFVLWLDCRAKTRYYLFDLVVLRCCDFCPGWVAGYHVWPLCKACPNNWY